MPGTAAAVRVSADIHRTTTYVYVGHWVRNDFHCWRRVAENRSTMYVCTAVGGITSGAILRATGKIACHACCVVNLFCRRIARTTNTYY